MTSELIIHLWESTLFATVACVLIILFRKGSSWSRHLIAWVAFLKFLIPFSLFQGLFPYSYSWGNLWNLGIFNGEQAVNEEVPLVNLEMVLFDIPDAVAASDFPWTEILIFAWLSGFLFLFTQRWTQYIRCKKRITNTSSPADAGWHNLARIILGPHENTLPNIVISVDEQLHAGVFGLVNTTIVIPEKMDKAFDPNDREAFLRHELQHVLKKDNLWLFIQKCIRDLLWFHPLAYWLDRQISSEREIMRDEEVLQQTNNIKSYINCLMKASNIELPTSYTTSVGLKGSPFARRLRAIATYKSSLLKKLISGIASVLAVTAMAALFLLSTNPVIANDDDNESEKVSVKELLHKHYELQEEMEKVRSSLNETSSEYERTVGRLRRALLSDNFDEDLSPDEAALADRFLARLEEQMNKQARREENRERDERREGDFDDGPDEEREGIGREKLHMIKNQLREVSERLDWLSEQSEDRDLNDREQAQMRELKMARGNLSETLHEYSDRDEENDEDI